MVFAREKFAVGSSRSEGETTLIVTARSSVVVLFLVTSHPPNLVGYSESIVFALIFSVLLACGQG